jgi:hypothetical protein
MVEPSSQEFMQDMIQTAALLMLTISHLILQWRCQEYRTSNRSYTEWIQSASNEFVEGFNEFGAILNDIADGLENSPSKQEPSMGEGFAGMAAQALMSRLAENTNYASESAKPQGNLQESEQSHKNEE